MYELHAAAEKGDIESIKELIEQGANIDEADKDRAETPLYYAIRKRHIETILYMVKTLGAKTDVWNTSGTPPLHEAIWLDDLAVVRCLVNDCGANARIRCRTQYYFTTECKTGLHIAAKYSSVPLVQFLVQECGLDVEARTIYRETALYLAAMRGNMNVVEYLIKYCKAVVDVKDMYGKTSLHAAAEQKWTKLNADQEFENQKHISIIQFLIKDCGVSVDIKDKEGKTPLHLASQRSNIHTIKYLVSKQHAHIDAMDNKGNTPLHDAASYSGSNIQTNKILVELGADLNAKNTDGRTPLDLARTDEIKQFLKKCAKHQQVKKENQKLNPVVLTRSNNPLPIHLTKFPLHDAAKKGDLSNLIELVSAGYSINEKEDDEWGHAPLHKAAFSGKIDVLEFLISIGADVNIADNNNATPLHYAAQSFMGDSIKAISCLIEAGRANLDAKNKDGKTPLDLAYTDEKKQLLKKYADEQNYKKAAQPSTVFVTKPNKPLPATPVKQTLSNDSTKETSTEVQELIAITPQQFVDNVQAEIKATNEQLARTLATQIKLQEHLEILTRTHGKQVEIDQLKNKLNETTKDLAHLQPQIDLQKAKNETLDLLSQKPNAIEFYNVTYTFLKLFFKGLAATHNQPTVLKSNGTLSSIANIVSKISSFVSFLPFGSVIAQQLERELRGQDLKILKKRIVLLVLLSAQLETKFIIEKIARELTLRHEDSIMRVDNTKIAVSSFKQKINEFYKEAEFTSIQELAQFAVSLIVAELFAGSNVDVKTLLERCLAAVIKETSTFESLSNKIERFFDQNSVTVKSGKHTGTVHYQSFFNDSGVRIVGTERHYSSDETKHVLLGYRIGTLKEAMALKLNEEKTRNQNSNATLKQSVPAAQPVPKPQTATSIPSKNPVDSATSQLELTVLKQKAKIDQIATELTIVKDTAKKDVELYKEQNLKLVNEVATLKQELQQKSSDIEALKASNKKESSKSQKQMKNLMDEMTSFKQELLKDFQSFKDINNKEREESKREREEAKKQVNELTKEVVLLRQELQQKAQVAQVEELATAHSHIQYKVNNVEKSHSELIEKIKDKPNTVDVPGGTLSQQQLDPLTRPSQSNQYGFGSPIHQAVKNEQILIEMTKEMAAIREREKEQQLEIQQLKELIKYSTSTLNKSIN